MSPKSKGRGGGMRRLFLLAFMSCIVPSIILQNYTQILPINNEGYGETSAFIRTATTPKPRATLVHYDPYFMGGFRNQHMRFVAFVSFAITHNISQILLPSLRWMDPYNKPASIHHELLFDVSYWNSRAESLGMPTLVNYDPKVLEGIIFSSGSNNETILSPEVIPCWNRTSSLYSGIDEAFLRNPSTPIRKTNTWQLIGQGELYSHCRRTPGANGENNPDKIQETAREKMKNNSTSTGVAYRYTHLIPHGGLISSGRLWHDYNSLQNTRQKASESVLINGQVVQIHPEHVSVEKKVYQLLRPSQYLRSAADGAIDRAMQNITLHHAADKSKNVTQKPRLLALHPRMEPEMFGHRCGKNMEKSLHFIFELLRTFPPFHDANSTNGYRFDVAFIAVSREQMESKNYGHFGPIIEKNLNALNHAREHGLFDQKHSLTDSTSGNTSRVETRIPIFESGRGAAASVQFPTIGQSTGEEPTFDTPESLGVTELVASIINFFTLVNADIFVGVKGSTYSTDAFSVRYYKQKDADGTWAENYIVGRQAGISRLYGPAAPHSC